MYDEPIPVEPDEADETLAVFESLLRSVTNPVFRICLEEAGEGIAHFAGRDDSGPRVAAAA
jgi:hypothetical protein